VSNGDEDGDGDGEPYANASQISVILIDRYPLMEKGFGRLNMNS
jgi:hypothetical protein